ncbi:MAG: hypothetical protein ABJB12_19250 [Pseudomonadota bacterium]
MKYLRHPARIALFASAFGSAGCGALLGIEDVHEGPANGTEMGGSGEGGDPNPNGGTTSGDAGASASGSSHAGAATGGASVGGSGNPNGGTGVGGAAGGATSTGEAGAGGSVQTGSTVTGHVIDLRGHKLSGVAVEIAGKQATTDGGGAFTVTDVPAVYDASLVVHYLSTVTQTHGYVFQGLKRRDPTLQVYQGLVEQTQSLDATFSGADQSATGTRTISLSLAGPDGAFERRDAPKPTLATSLKWAGPAETQEQAHALVWQNNATSGLPEGYYAYATAPLMLSSGTTAHAAVGLSLLPTAIASSPVTGTVTPASFSDRTDSVSLRFSSGATMRLVASNPASSTFSYLVPTLAGATITFAASEGCAPSSPGCGIVHKDGLLGGGAALTVKIPSPVTNLTLAPATAVDSNTQFSLTPAVGSTSPFVSVLINGTSGNDRLYVISSERSFKLPSVLNGAYSLVHGESYRWQVETHGTAASVDELAGPSGFIDAFSVNHSDFSPSGPSTGDGAYTLSAAKFFTVAN